MPKRTNGEGTIYQRSNGLWCAELTIGYDEDGKRIKKSFSSMDLDKLQKKVNDEKFKLNRNIVTQNSDYTVAEWITFWLENYKQNSIKPTTYDRYEYAFNGHIKSTIGKYKLNKIKPEMIQQLYNRMSKNKQSTASIKKVHIVLNQAFVQAINNELLYQNPCRGTTIPKIEKRKAVAMSLEEQKTFIESCPKSTLGNFFLFALNTGMRVGEVTALTWNNIDFDMGLIHVGKTAATVKNRDIDAESKTKIILSTPKTENSQRIIPMNATAKKILQEQKKKNMIFVFSSSKNTILQNRNIRRAYSSILKKGNLPNNFTIHTLRHTFATRLIEQNANAKVVSELLGHSSIQITLDLYGHVMPNTKKEVISLLD